MESVHVQEVEGSTPLFQMGTRYNAFKKRAVAFTPPDKDRDVEPLLKALSHLPGIATVWSCAGHPEDGEMGYVCFVAAHAYREIWYRLMEAICSTGVHVSIAQLGPSTSAGFPLDQPYMAFQFYWGAATEEVKQLNIERLCEVIKTVQVTITDECSEVTEEEQVTVQDIMDTIQQFIDRGSHTIIEVGADEDTPTYAYSVGLYQHTRQEVFCSCLPTGISQPILDHLVLELLEDPELTELKDLQFMLGDGEQIRYSLKRVPLQQLTETYSHLIGNYFDIQPEDQAVVVFLPDGNNILPGEPGYNSDYKQLTSDWN